MVYIRANGVVLNIELRGRGEPVVLISDIAEDLTSWCFQAASFGQMHFLMQVDNRGSGWSDCPEACSIETMARDIICLMDLVGVDRSHLVGLGLGGMVAQETALQRPGRVNGLVLASTSSSATPEQRLVLSSLIDSAKGGEDLLRLSASMLPWLYSEWFLENDRWREYVTRARTANYRWTSWDGAGRQLEAMLDYSSADRLGSIRAPTRTPSARPTHDATRARNPSR
jgi:pimeloyl-ACP methyl ester carboxylesterase